MMTSERKVVQLVVWLLLMGLCLSQVILPPDTMLSWTGVDGWMILKLIAGLDDSFSVYLMEINAL